MTATYDPDHWRRQNPRPLYGLDLRYQLTDLIMRSGRPWTVKELVEALTAAGFTLDGRPSKTVSDVLRAETKRGRVDRVGWGVYRVGYIPGATRRRIAKRARLRRAWVQRAGWLADVPSAP